MKLNNDCTLLVSSCDNYEDLWPVFFEILKREWPDLSYPIVLNTESKSFCFEGLDIITYQLYKNDQKISWSRRLRETLEKIETDYIIFMLDDFFLQGRVDSFKVEKCLTWMKDNKDVSTFCFMETYSKNKKDLRFPEFEKRPIITHYKFNCQAAIWRRKRLIQYLKGDETPWEWERYGNWRSYKHPFHTFYSFTEGGNYIMPYLYKVDELNWGGLAVYRGKWYMPYVQPLFQKHNIEVDFSIRGCANKEEFMPIRPKLKEEYTGWKRKLFFLRPLSWKIYEMLDVLKNIKHFF